MRFKLFVATTALLSASLAAHADTVTFDFTYSSTSGAVAGETATGNGSFTLNYTPGFRTGTLDAFSFTDTIDSSDGDSTFTYTGLGSVLSSDFVLTLGAEQIAEGNLTTKSLFGTDGAFGPVDFELLIVTPGSDTGSTSAEDNRYADYLAGDTTGTTNVAFVGMTTPEPSGFFLLGTGLLGVAGVMKRRFA